MSGLNTIQKTEEYHFSNKYIHVYIYICRLEIPSHKKIRSDFDILDGKKYDFMEESSPLKKRGSKASLLK